MDLYSKDDVHLDDKRQALNLRKDDLLSMEESHEQSQAHFAVDEPLDVQLRFDLGSLVDTHGLLDTQEPRDSHWDFVRHDQGSDREGTLLEHVKQDDNCGSWPAPSSQMDAQLFIDPQDDINEITDAFATKGKNVTNSAENENCSSACSYEQHVDATSWVDGKQIQKIEQKPIDDNKVTEDCTYSQLHVIETMEAAEYSVMESTFKQKSSGEDITDGNCDNFTSPNETKDIKNVSIATSIKEGENANGRKPNSPVHARKDSSIEDAPKTQIEDKREPQMWIHSVKGLEEQEVSEMTVVKEVGASMLSKKVTPASPAIDCRVLYNNCESSTIDNASLHASIGIDPDLKQQNLRSDSAEQKDETLKKVSPAMAKCDIQRDLSVIEVTSNLENVTDSSVVNGAVSSHANVASETHVFIRGEQVEKTDRVLELRERPTMADIDLDVGKETQVVGLLHSSKDGVSEATDSIDKSCCLKVGSGDAGTIGVSKHARRSEDLTTYIHDGESNKTSALGVFPVNRDGDLIDKGSNCSVPLDNHVFPTSASKDLNSHSESMEGSRFILESQRQSAMVSNEKEQVVKFSISIKDDASATREKEEEPRNLDDQTTGCALPALLEDKTVGVETSGDVPLGTYGTPKDSPYTSKSVTVGSKSMTEAVPEKRIGSISNNVLTVKNSSVEISVADNKYDSKCRNATTMAETAKRTTNSNSQHEITPERDQDDDSNNHLMHSTPKVNVLTQFRAGKPRNQKETHLPCEDVQVLTQVSETAVGRNDQKLLSDGQVTAGIKIMKQSDTKMHSSEPPSVISVSTTTTDVMPSLHVVASTTASDVISSKAKVSRRKSDKSTSKNKPKDTVQTNPIPIGLNEEPKSTKKGGSGRQNRSPKSGSKNVASQRKRKGMSSVIFQDSSSPIQSTDGFQSTPNANKTGSSISSRQHQHHRLPDLNVTEAIGSTQPFNEQQQVQLRAQILVYGSLIQGAAPEEALMIAAFSVIPGVSREARNDLDGSGRVVWEKTWQAAVERIEKKISASTPKSASQSTGVLTAFPSSSARTMDLSKVNCSTASPVLEAMNVSFLNSTPSDIQDKSSNKSGKSGAHKNLISPMAVNTISSLSGETHVNQSRSSKMQSAIIPMPSAAITHPAASPLSGTFVSQPNKPYTDLPQAMSPTYFPTPSLSHYPPGSSQWVPSPFSGPWASQTQSTVFTSPSLLLTQPQSLVNSNQSLETRKAVPLSSLSVPSDPILTTVATTVLGSSSLNGEPVQRKHAKPESRPRKRKKTDSEQPGSPNLVSNSCTAFGATQNPSHVSVASTNPFTFSEPLAMVVAETHASSNSVKSLMAPPTDSVLVPHRIHLPSTSEEPPGKTLSFQDSINNLEQAKLYAEEATSAADSSVRESASLWSQLKSQKRSGIISEAEMQLASSMIAATTAASVAKAAAAAARAAYEASRHAKTIGENALSSSNQENRLRQIGHGQDSSANVSISEAWRLPESCNSIISSAKLASEKKIGAASVSVMNAHNLSLVVKAAELAANAVSQVGAIMAMGESVPFTLDTLMEVGPEGVEKLLLFGPTYGREAEAPSLKAPENEASLKNTEVSEKNERRYGKTNQSNVRMDVEGTTVPTHDSLIQRVTQNSEHILIDDDHDTENHIVENSIVEVLHGKKGIQRVWFSAKVQKVEGQRILVLYDRLVSKDGNNRLEDWVDQGETINDVPKVRLAHSGTNIGFAGTRKRRREAMGNYTCSVGDHVDAFFHDGWCEGEVKEILEDGETKVKVHFPGESDTSLIKASMLRPSLVWRDGQWVMWNDIEKQESHLPSVGNDKSQVDTPIPKRQKLEKADVKSGEPAKQALDANVIDECIGTDITDSRMRVAGKTTTLESVADTSSEPISKVINGVPRSTKRRKFIEVSKHYVPSKASRVFLGVKENKDLSIVPLQFHIGSAEPSKQDAAKSKRTLASTQKTRQQKGQDVAVKVQLKSRNQVDKSSTNGKLKQAEELASRFKTQEERVMETEKQPEAVVNKESSISASIQGKSKHYPSRPAIQHPSVNEKQDSHISTVRGRETRSQSTHETARDAHVKARQNENPIVKSDGGYFQTKENPVSTYKEGNTQQTNQSMRRRNELPDKNKESERHPNTTKDTNKLKDVGKSGPETAELRRTSRKIQPTSKLLEGLQTAPNVGKSGLLHERGSKKASTSKGPS